MTLKYMRDDIDSKYKHLFETLIYRTSRKGAGYRKYNICSIGLNSKRKNQVITLELRGAHWKQKSKNIFVRFALEDNKIEIINARYFLDLPEWFKNSADNIKKIEWELHSMYNQFWIEYKEIQNKFPEYFL